MPCRFAGLTLKKISAGSRDFKNELDGGDPNADEPWPSLGVVNE
jgi:hypothetical protein